MNKTDAIQCGLDSRDRFDGTYLVILRTDHPDVAGDHYYVMRDREKHAWTPSETLIAIFPGSDDNAAYAITDTGRAVLGGVSQ